MTGFMPTIEITAGWITIITAVKTSERVIASEISSFFARQAAPVAMAAETPHTAISAEITMLSDGDSILRIFCPNRRS